MKKNILNAKKIMSIKIKTQFLLLLTVFFSLSCSHSFGQGCVSSLIINTAYDPCAHAAVGPGTPSSPVKDPKWIVTSLSPDNQALLSPGTLSTYPNYHAFVPVPDPAWVNHDVSGLSHFISMDNNADYPTIYGNVYDGVFTRTFNLCCSSKVTLDFNVEMDYCITKIDVDGTIIPGAAFCYTSGTPAHHVLWTTPTLIPGPHFIHVFLMNDAWTWPTNGYGFCLYGTVSTAPGNCLVREDMDPIVGSPTICSGASYTFTDLYPTGIWSSSPGSVSFSPIAGSPTSVTGITAGPVIISYSNPSTGCYATYSSTVVAIPDVCVYTTFTTDYNFNFTSSSPTATIYFYAVDMSGTPVCPTLFSTGPGVMSWATFTALLTGAGCPYSANGVCIVGVCDMGCCWGALPASFFPIGPLPPPTAPCTRCAWVNPAHKGYSPSGTNLLSSNASGISVMPNPNTGSFRINGALPSAKTSKTAAIEVTDLLGKTIYTGEVTIENAGINKEIILGNNLPGGIYMLRVKNKEVNEVLKFTLSK